MTRTAHAILIALIALLTPFALADLSITADGTTTPYSVIAPDGSVVSRHVRKDKAIERAANESAAHGAAGYRVRETTDLIVTMDPPKPTEPPAVIQPPDPPVDPLPALPFNPVVPDDATHLYLSNDGDDTASGLTEAAAVKSPWRVQEIIAQVQQADDNPVFAIRPRRGDMFPMFGRLGGHLPTWRPNQYTDLNGAGDRWHTVKPYGEGADPIFVQDSGEDAFSIARGASYIQIISIEAHGGQLVNCISNRAGLAIIDCTGINAEVIVQAEKGNQFTDLHIHNTRLRDVVVGDVSHRRQGFFLSRVGGTWTFCLNIMINCGWSVDGGQSTYNHGLYATGENGPVTEAWGNVGLGNSGAAMQFRSAGNVHHCFAAFNGDRGINWGETRGSVTSDVGGVGKIHDCVAFQLDHDGAAMAIGNMAKGQAYNLTAIADKGPGLVINANRGDNPDGGRYFGINDLELRDSAIRGISNRGAIELEKTGWGYEDGAEYGVSIHTNRLDGGIGHKADFADAMGKVVVGANATADLSNLTGPVDTPEFRADVWERRVTAFDLVEKYRGHE